MSGRRDVVAHAGDLRRVELVVILIVGFLDKRLTHVATTLR